MLEAAEAGDRAAALAALKAGDDVDARAADGTTALIWAAYNGDAELVERLIAAGADLDVKNEFGTSALSEAAIGGYTAVIAALLARGAEPNMANPEGETPLMAVARTGNVEAAKLLLDAGADVNAIELWGQQSALMWAAAQQQPAMIKLLIARGAQVDARGAVRNWERKVISEPRPKDMNQGGFTPLLYAAREGCIECAKELVAGGADLDLPDPHRVTPLDHGAVEPALRFRGVLDRGGCRHQQVGSLRPLAALPRRRHEHDPRDGQRRDGRAAEHGQAEGARRRAPVARQRR